MNYVLYCVHGVLLSINVIDISYVCPSVCALYFRYLKIDKLLPIFAFFVVLYALLAIFNRKK